MPRLPTVLLLSLLLVRLREPSIEGLAPVAGAYVLVLAALWLLARQAEKLEASATRSVSQTPVRD